MNTISCDSEKLSLSLITPKLRPSHDNLVLFLPGGGKTLGKERFEYFQDKLKQEGFVSASFNFSGVAESSGEIQDSSLRDRIQQTTCVVKYLRDKFPEKDLALYGVSMGGYIALGAADKLLNPPNKLVLHAPAAYTKEAHTVNFGNEFTRILRQNKSWKSSQSFRWLRDYGREVLFLMGDEDKIIPSGVSSQYRQILEGKLGTEYVVISGMQHNIWKGDSGRNYQDIILEKLFSFLKDDGSGGDE
jgi:alpha-beta hydrolase superfamily lysophospholipase